jgi:hypothetical protein
VQRAEPERLGRSQDRGTLDEDRGGSRAPARLASALIRRSQELA